MDFGVDMRTETSTLNMPAESAGLFALELGHPAVVVDLLMRGEMAATAAQLLGGHWKDDHWKEWSMAGGPALVLDAYRYKLKRSPINALRDHVYELLCEAHSDTLQPIWHLFRVQ